MKTQQTNRFSYAHFLQRVKKELNISKNIELTPHTLRHCFATYQAINGMPLPVLQQVLGHASIKTTSLYWKSTKTPWEKLFTDKWLAGKTPQEPPKPIESDTEKNNWEVLVNIHQKTNIFVENKSRNSEQKYLETKNQLLQAKLKQLEQEINKVNSLLEKSNNENNEHKKTINDLQNNLKKALNDKENLTKQLLQVKNEKNILLKILSTDLKQQQENLSDKEQNNYKLHQQLTAQIQVLTKN